MNNEIKIKNIIIYLAIIIISFITADIFFNPEINFKTNFFHNLMHKILIYEDIAPQRLFVKAWRITKNEYIDSSLNGQNWAKWRLRYFRHIKTIDDANVAINSMLASLNDPYTKFMKSNSFKKQKIILDSQITGVGILFYKAGEDVIINHVIANSPAQNANIYTGDYIISINGKEVKNLETDEIAELINISKDTVDLVIKRKNEIIKKTLIKKVIPIKTMNYVITKDNIGIIYLSNIMGKRAANDFDGIIKGTNNTNGIIIDLRNNYGGIIANAMQMANLMLTNEMILSIKSRNGDEYQIYADNEKIFKDKPVVILIDRNTASAAEVLAGTLRNNINAILIGEKSFGKNSIQQVIPMQNGTGLIITSNKYILPDGKDINNKGLIPDITVNKKSTKNNSEDIQLQEAVKLIQKIVKNEK